MNPLDWLPELYGRFGHFGFAISAGATLFVLWFAWGIAAQRWENTHLTVPMVEIMEFENGKVKNSRMFFDTAQFPPEFMKQMKQGCEKA